MLSAAGAPSSAGGAAKASRSQRRRANREAALDRAEREGVLDGRSSAGRKRLEQVRAREASKSTGTPPSQARSKAIEPPTADDDQVPVRDRSENNSPPTHAVLAQAFAWVEEGFRGPSAPPPTLPPPPPPPPPPPLPPSLPPPPPSPPSPPLSTPLPPMPRLMLAPNAYPRCSPPTSQRASGARVVHLQDLPLHELNLAGGDRCKRTREAAALARGRAHALRKRVRFVR